MRTSFMSAAAGVVGLMVALSLPSVPAPSGEAPLAIRGGRIFTVTQGVLEHGVIIIRDGMIAEIGPNVEIPPGARIVEAGGSFICPGFIDAGTNLGTVEYETVERDDDEPVAPVTPQLRALDAFNPGNRLIPEVLKDGITSLLLRPSRGNLLSGQSAFIHLAGTQDLEATVVKRVAAVHGSLGDVLKPRSKQNPVYPFTRMGAAALLRQTLSDTKYYFSSEHKANAGEKTSAQFQLAALVPVIKGELPLVIAADRLDDLLTAVRIGREFGIRVVIEGGAHAWRIKDRLSAGNVPVILAPRTFLGTTVETQGARPENAAWLQEAGVKIAFQSGGIHDLGRMLPAVRNAVRYGLSPDAALRSLTINTAEIFGVADRLGSLEKGKYADIVIFDNDPMLTSARVRTAIVNGRVVLSGKS